MRTDSTLGLINRLSTGPSPKGKTCKKIKDVEMYTNQSFKVWIVLLFVLALIFPGTYAVGQLLSPRERAKASPARVYDATAARDAAIVYPKFPTSAHPLVYDATAAREAAIVYANEVGNLRPWVYDATGAMLKAVVFPPSHKITSIHAITHRR
jgi:hypothetical protein